MIRFAPLLLGLLCAVGCHDPGPVAAPSPSGPALPANMKGWELYIWQDAGQTWFTLLPGTNRVKTAAEVFSSPRDTNGPDGIAITIAGLDALGGVLARLPAGETVTILALRYPATELERVATPEAVESYARSAAAQLGLVLQ